MEDSINNFCYETGIEWTTFLQHWPESPVDFLFPLTEKRSAHEILPPGIEQGGETSALLTDVMSKDDENFQVTGTVDGAGKFLDMNSFLGDPSAGNAENDVDGGEGFQVDVCKYMEEGNRVHVGADHDVVKGKDVDVDGCKKRQTGEDDFSRKRRRDLAVKSRQRKKVYVECVEAKCRMLEERSWRLEQSLRFSSLENAVLKNELSRMKKDATLARHVAGERSCSAELDF